jgi:predicted hydrocarbon binding protein
MATKINLLRDKERGELFFHGISSIIVNRSDQVSVQREIERMMGPTAKRIVYKASKKSSISRFYLTYQRMKKENPKRISKKDLLMSIFDELEKMGYGLFELTYFNEKKLNFRVSVKNSFNTFDYKQTSVPICHILSGVLAGIFEIIFQIVGMNCVEKTCSAMRGKHPECEFEIFSNKQKIRRRGEIKIPSYLVVSDKKKEKLEEFQVDYDEEKGEIWYEGVNSMIISRDVYAIEYGEFSRIIGPATKSLVYKVHKFEGIHALSIGKKILIPLIRPFNKKLLAEKFVEEIWRRGYGSPRIIEFDAKKKFGIIRVENSFNALGYDEGKQGRRNYPVCYFLTGVIAGGATLVFSDENMVCYETECIGKGDDYCEFVIKGGEG